MSSAMKEGVKLLIHRVKRKDKTIFQSILDDSVASVAPL